MGALKVHEKPVREKRQYYSVKIVDGYTMADILAAAREEMHDPSFEIPIDARVSLHVDNYHYSCDGCCADNASAEAYLGWHSKESDYDFDKRTREYERLVLAQKKRQAKKTKNV